MDIDRRLGLALEQLGAAAAPRMDFRRPDGAVAYQATPEGIAAAKIAAIDAALEQEAP
jgi:hypothetical protein